MAQSQEVVPLNANQEKARRQVVQILEALLEEFPASRGVPEEVKTARNYVRAILAVETEAEARKHPKFREQEAIVQRHGGDTTWTRVQIVDAIRYAKKIGVEVKTRTANPTAETDDEEEDAE